MISAMINGHIGSFRHVAFNTGCPFTSRFMVMVSTGVIFLGRMLMAGSTKAIVIVFNFDTVGIVTVRALDAFVIHLTLDKRTEDIYFVHDLAVFMVSFWSHRLTGKVIVKIIAPRKVRMDDTAPRMAGSTGLNLSFNRCWVFTFNLR